MMYKVCTWQEKYKGLPGYMMLQYTYIYLTKIKPTTSRSHITSESSVWENIDTHYFILINSMLRDKVAHVIADNSLLFSNQHITMFLSYKRRESSQSARYNKVLLYDVPEPSICRSFSSWNQQRQHRLIFQHAIASPQLLFLPVKIKEIVYGMSNNY